jgi:hypothetical protein
VFRSLIPLEVDRDWLTTASLVLLLSARTTALGELFPFQSMNRVCFARASPFPVGEPASVFAEILPDGEYRVFRGSPYDDEQVMLVASTFDAEVATRLLVRELASD